MSEKIDFLPAILRPFLFAKKILFVFSYSQAIMSEHARRLPALLRQHVIRWHVFRPHGRPPFVTWRNPDANAMRYKRQRLQVTVQRSPAPSDTKTPDPRPVVHEKVLTPSPLQRKLSGNETGNKREPRRKEKGAIFYKVRLIRYIDKSDYHKLCKRTSDACANPNPHLDNASIDDALMVSGLNVEDSDSDDEDESYKNLCLYQKSNEIIDSIIPEEGSE